MAAPTGSTEAPASPLGTAPDATESHPIRSGQKGLVGLVLELTKARLNALVLVTAAVGFLLAEPRFVDWPLLGWTLLGTALLAASASMGNQLAERRRDALMRRTAGRPLPTGRVRPAVVFALAVLGAYFGIAVLALQVNLLTAFLGGLNVVIYVLVYTPLKPLTTFNTLVGAVCGAIPPMMGWAAVTGGLQTGAWTLGAILFVWQMPHFLALAWMYRDDYRRGGMSMLPVLDASGEMTSRTMVLSSLMLAPLGLAVTLGGLAGWISAAANLALAVAMAAMSWRFYMVRTDAMARRVFFASIIYLPIALGVMVIDRGPVTQEGWLRAGRPPISDSIPSLRPEAPLEPHR